MTTLKRTILIILCILVLALAAATVYFYKKSANKTSVSATEVKSLVIDVGKHVVLPDGETPTLATVSDPNALKNQSFFANAQKGDKVLIYTNAKEAILYRPSIDKIITIAPLNIETPAKQSDVVQQSVQPTSTPADTTKTVPPVKKK